jgi:hypothetical protein
MADQLYTTQLDSQHIRLLKPILSSISNDENLQYTLESFDLREAPSYVALSYTWGPPEGSDFHKVEDTTPEFNHSVFVNGRHILVTQNLFDGLVVLRQKAIDGFLWIDAICINQQDFGERSSQVSVMDLIYSGADHVVVWLGPDTRQEAQEVSKIFQKLSQYWDDIVSESNWDAFDQPGHVIADRAGLPGLRAFHMRQEDDQVLAWKPVILFFQQRWFHRIWTIQEVLLATHVRVLYGDTELLWKNMWNAGNLLKYTKLGDTLGNIFQISRVLHSFENEGPDSLDSIHDFFAPNPGSSFIAIMHLSELCGADNVFSNGIHTGLLRLITKVVGRVASEDSIAGLIVLVLFSIRQHQATDPRDKVFGTLGLLSAAAKIQGMQMPEIRVDYSKPSEAIFLDVAKCILSNTNLLSYLNFVQDISQRNHPSLPSWVAGLKPAMLRLPLVWHEGMPMEACFDASNCYSRLHRKAPFTIVDTTLRCSGSYIGQVHRVSQPLQFLLNPLRSYKKRDLSKHIDEIAEMVMLAGDTYRTGQCPVEALWRTLVFDTAGYMHPASQKFGWSFRHWLLSIILCTHFLKTGQLFSSEYYQDAYQHYDLLARRDTSGTMPTLEALEEFSADMQHDEAIEQLDQKAEDYMLLASKCMAGRRFLITDNGYMCVGLESTAPGDSVWILDGGLTPFVLRDVEDTSAKAEEPLARRMMLVGECYVHGIMHGEALERDGFAWQDIVLV